MMVGAGHDCQIQLLGGARVRSGQDWLAFAPDNRYRLLAYLAWAGDWVSRDRLADLFWPDSGSREAKRNLRQLLQRLYGLAWLESQGHGLEIERHRLRWRVASDVAAFRWALEGGELDEALSCYGGPLLDGLESYNSVEFINWLEAERAQLHSSWRSALLRRAGELEELGRRDRAVTLLRALLQQDDLDEEALRAYMGAAAREGTGGAR